MRLSTIALWWGRLTLHWRVVVALSVVAIFAVTVAVVTYGPAGDARGAEAEVVDPSPRPEVAVITPLTIPTEKAVLSEVGPMSASAPVRLTIASIGVDTPLMDLGLMPDGSLEVPPDGTLAGWFTGAPTPGERGPAVIAGHVDWIGPAIFHDLHLVVPGDLIDVARADGSTAVFAVTEVGQYPKDEFPTEAVYGAVSFAGLRVITCGGVFNKATGHYDDNFVVFAELESSTPATAG